MLQEPRVTANASLSSNWLNRAVYGLIVFAIVSLTLIGLVSLASASQSFSQSTGGYFHKQLALLAVGLIAGCGMLYIDLDWLRRRSLLIGIVITVLLVAVLVPGLGVRVNGAKRWLNCGFTRLQVSEFAKLGLVCVLAHYLALQQRMIEQFKEGFIWPMAMIGCVFGLIMAEPDYSTAFLCGLVGYVLLFLAGTRLRYLLPCIGVGLGVFAVAVLLNPIRLKRIISFLDVEGNKSDGAYQVWQGILAFGAGGFRGVGLGNGRQQRAFLPEAHTDFIFPVIGEELGFIFTMGVACLFLGLFVVSLYKIRRAPDLYTFLLSMGSLLFVTFQALINMGVVMGLLPSTGMCLPFISYGGANLIVMLMFIGLMLNCFRKWDAMPLRKARDI